MRGRSSRVIAVDHPVDHRGDNRGRNQQIDADLHDMCDRPELQAIGGTDEINDMEDVRA